MQPIRGRLAHTLKGLNLETDDETGSVLPTPAMSPFYVDTSANKTLMQDGTMMSPLDTNEHRIKLYGHEQSSTLVPLPASTFSPNSVETTPATSALYM